ncbi:hypothetical protein GGR57DRAFT_485249 [Xylariaceae sp. FL1272]|nr:hypothetical protein GGR57DRAFT_485249 [Xylariaceae sp. FL1272]
MTITFVNKHNMAVSTTHGRNAGAPAATSGNVAPGTMAVGATAAFAVPTNWAGRVAVAEARWGPLVNGRLATLLEANFNYAAGYGVAVPDFDVSYVDAYSVPMTCACNGKTLAGCNKALFSLHTCPAGDNHSGSCYNPLKADNHATAATAFFAPCSKAAYTYPNDHEANAYGVCQSAQVTCCIGAACPAGPKQS